MLGKNLVIDVHHHWMPDEHYRRPELHIHPDEEVVHKPDRFRIRQAGSDFPTVVQLKNAVAIIKKTQTSAKVKKKVLGDNARKLFGGR
jgi:hypothetical protein